VPSVYANESRLAQVFLNVIINAAHAIPKGRRGEIRVRTTTGAAGEAIISVSDNGAGMKPEMLSRIFDPFFTTKPTGLGTGLGLWICQGIITALTGRIEVTSEVDKGATFTIVLPQREVVASEPRIPIHRPSRRWGNVLVVDDQAEILRVIERALGDRHTVTCTSDGEVALANIQRGERYSVVLCDMSMPMLDGMSLYKRAVLLDERLRSRFIFLTGAITDEESHRFLATHRHLAKPFELRELIDAVAERMGVP
jgi:CheY-like chemotaxis protein